MQQNSSKGISIASLICGLASIVALCITLPALCASANARSQGGAIFSLIVLPVMGLILGIVGIVLGATGMKKAGLNGEPKGLAVAGLVCGIVGAVFCGIATLCDIIALASVA